MNFGIKNAKVLVNMSAMESLSDNYILAKSQLDAVMARQGALMSNLANVETPNYKRIDLDKNFELQLSEMIKSKNISGLSTLKPITDVDLSAKNVGDAGNNVEIDKELMCLSENSMRHQFLIKVADETIKRTKSAITGNSGGI